MDIPVAWLEGKADLIRSTNDARKEIIKKSGESINNQIQIPKIFVEKAVSKYASKIIKEQINLDEITTIAAQQLSNENKNDVTADESDNKEISDDWLNEFENIAKLKSSEDLKLIFGKILSGEISRPGKFSIRTLKLISQLDNEAASLFQTFCNNTSALYIGNKTIRDARVVVFKGTAGSNALSKYGLSFDNLNILQEYGLIISDYNSYYPFDLAILNDDNTVFATIELQNKRFFLVPTDRKNYNREIKLYGVSLTKSGKELFEIVTKNDSEQYFKDFEKFMEEKQLNLHYTT
ncbi:DUF2806 domain-containing protein [Soonwooa purpurea]